MINQADLGAPAQFIVDEVLPSYWKVTFENGPVNLIDADSIDQLARPRMIPRCLSSSRH